MKALNRCVSISAFALALLVGASAAQAQATRTWVSGIGDDVNPCSRTAPCKTFAGAISKTAAKGEINALDPGGFGAVTITKSITIDGAEAHASILAAGVNGIIINALSTDIVTIRNVSINGAGTGLSGIRILSAAQVHIENCKIQNFVNRGIDIANGAANVQVFIENTVVNNNIIGGAVPAGNSGGLHVRPTNGTFNATVNITDSHFDQSTVGIRAEANTFVSMTGGSISGNAGFGALAITTGAASVINLQGTAVAKNSTGVRADGANAVVRLAGTMITGNATGVSVNAGQVISAGNNFINGNTTNGAPTSTPGPL